ncbi:hypothetical protein LQE94_10170 [Mediterraneibacter sp. NSJ-151]|uniref:hypothetical protein n=1 Tax=Mediterraneibacter sp. NSJ-151 TaxID=2897708 RepID=UPI001F0A48A9|nr:hypothetical protein [Mediterraneibacter sp. NSJ-151]MCH4280380.1 hypothetical protein [Mediterraneibacter sp. NSJ-151]
MVCVAAVALGSSTYAWFVNNTRVTAGEFSATATTSNALEISDNGNTWLTSIDLRTNMDTWAPVSTTDMTLFAKDTTWGKSNNNKGNVVTAWEDATPNIHYYTKTFYLKANQDCRVQLDANTTLKETTANANGILNAMRIGFVSGEEKVVYQVADTSFTSVASSRDTTEDTTAVDGITKAIKGTKGTSGNTYAVAATEFTRNATITTNGSTGVTTASDAIITPSTDNSTLGAANNNYVVDLTANTAKEITVYIWLEGCDFDCVSSIAEGSISTTLEFQACAK